MRKKGRKDIRSREEGEGWKRRDGEKDSGRKDTTQSTSS